MRTKNSGYHAALPYPARVVAPVIRELDGRVSVPHFVGCGSDGRVVKPPVDLRFHPDADWIAQAVGGTGEEQTSVSAEDVSGREHFSELDPRAAQ